MTSLKRNHQPIGMYAKVTTHTDIIKESQPTPLSEKDYKKYKTRKALKHLETIDTRDALKPYKGQRLGFEGVLIQVNPPNKKNSYSYGLVFASLFCPDRQIELDHVVIKTNITAYENVEMELFSRYYFTAEVGSYQKTINLLGIPAQQENFMLHKINMQKITPVETSQLTQPSQYIQTRVNNVVNSKTKKIPHSEAELYAIIDEQPNDGSKEQFIEEYSQAFQSKRLNALDVVNALYGIDK